MIPSARQGLSIAALAVIYVVTARLGLLLDAVGGFATVVWAPTGIAIAAMLLLGPLAAAGIAAGALVANLLAGAAPAVAAGIATGNTLEAVAAWWMLRQLRFRTDLERVTDVLAFIAVAALAPVVSATIGVGSILAAGAIGAAETGTAWRTWWLGDFIGAVLVGPFILVWSGFEWRAGARDRLVEVLGLLLSLVAVGAVVFVARASPDVAFLEAYLLFPPLIWASLRFEQRGATAAVLLVSLIAIAATMRGGGPFHGVPLRESLFALQTFMGIVAVSFLALAAALAERSRARETLREALESESAANQSKADFLAVMSHELRTPLNAIAGYAEILAMEVAGPLTAEQRDAIDRIQRNEQHLAALVNDVLGFAHLEAGRLAVRPVPVQLAGLVESLRAFVGPDLRRKRLILETDGIDPSLAVLADPEKLRQILLNLLGNAVKYSNEDGRIAIHARAEPPNVTVEVIDSGIGIPAAQLPRVFEAFFQVERGHTRRYDGVGLGLTIARDLARAMGGEVNIESRNGGGTAASITLPAAPEG